MIENFVNQVKHFDQSKTTEILSCLPVLLQKKKCQILYEASQSVLLHAMPQNHWNIKQINAEYMYKGWELITMNGIQNYSRKKNTSRLKNTVYEWR